MKKKVISAFLAIFMGISLIGCGENNKKATMKSDKAGVLLVGLQGDPKSYNPDNKPDDYAYMVNQNIFNRLVKLDYENNILPDLAETWKVSDDGKEYTFNLVKGVKWHDGTLFTSDDVKWTFEEIIHNNGIMGENFSVIDSIVVPDDNTVVVKLKQPDASFLGTLAFYGTFIIPKHIYEGTDWNSNPANEKPIGTGPFKFVENQKGVSVTLETNKEYFKEVASVDKLVFKVIPDSNTAVQAFYNGELDILGVHAPTAEVAKLEKTDGVKTVKKLIASRYYVAFNMRKAPFDKLEVREAIELGINRQDIVDKVFKGIGQGAEGFYSPVIKWAYNDKDVLPKRNIEKAKALLEQAGLKADKDGNYLSVELTIMNMDPFPDIATVIKANLKEIGVNVKIDAIEDATWAQKCIVDHNFDFTILCGIHGPDPGMFYNRVGSKGGIQIMGYNNPEVDKLFAEGSILNNQDERGEKYKEVQKILSKDLPIVPLDDDVNVSVAKSYISGLPTDDGIGKVAPSEYSLIKIKQ